MILITIQNTSMTELREEAVIMRRREVIITKMEFTLEVVTLMLIQMMRTEQMINYLMRTE